MNAAVEPVPAVRLLQGGRELFPALIDAMDRAHHDVWFASYIVHTDAVSLGVVQAMRRAAKRGVRVRVVVDGFGSRHALGWWQAQLKDTGVALAVFRPLDRWWHWFQPGQLRRLHQKLCVVDAAVAFVGGINLIDDHTDLSHGALERPRLDFAVALEGEVVPTVSAVVRRVWLRAWLGREWADELRGFLASPQWSVRARGWMTQWWQGQGRPDDRAPTPVTGPRLVVRDNLRHRHAIEREYWSAIEQAQARIELICPYFYPSARLLRALGRAARRGVRIRLLLQGRVDYAVAAWAAQALYGALMARGIEVYEYHEAFLHAKVALVDQQWVTVGSSNLDPTSLLLNLEANVVVRDAAVNHQVHEAFERALTGAQPVPAHRIGGGVGAWLRRAAVAWLAQVYLRLAGGRGSRY
ncbi:cardiolipin synthase ClsB [Inhella gelatinilytica]|uniref:Cardiolipin synthase B n=1 Tax=Inhella gelatinilytica TaxID=2795030 RepID=A0A931IWW1_9BURK|nr:cardiolipin synthase ClsB [Inhella gelatinilytica]MBH9552539.1 cardiolipin synthase ClsB [Inhella gelatinilytica]